MIPVFPTANYHHAAATYDPRWLGRMNFPDPAIDSPTSQTLVNQMFDYYQDALGARSRAFEYLEQHGINDLCLLKELGVGYVDRTLGKQLPSGQSTEGASIRGNLQRLGLLVGSGGEFFRGALVFPNKKANGDITEAFGQRITPRLRSGTPYQLYWSVTPAGFFNSSALTDNRKIILCQTPLDLLTLRCAGFNNVVSTLGTRNFGVEHLLAMETTDVSEVCIAFDNTPEANIAACLVAQVLSASDIACCRATLPPGMSVNECLVAYGAAMLSSVILGAKTLVQTYERMQENFRCD